MYDIEDHKPTRTYFDFHHALREKDWVDIYKNGYHPVIWLDASGHRILWSGYYKTYSISWSLDPGIVDGLESIIEDIIGIDIPIVDVDASLKLELTISEDPMFDGMLFWSGGSTILPDLDFTIEWEIEIFYIKYSGSYTIDLNPALEYLAWEFNYLMQKLIKKINAKIDVDLSLPYWWGQIEPWRAGMDILIEGETLNVKDFNHWVYIYDWGTAPFDLYLDPEPDLAEQSVYSCKVGYVGDNIYNGDYADMWPYIDSNEKTTEIPWMEIYDPGNDFPETGEFRIGTHDNGWEAWEWRETYLKLISLPPHLPDDDDIDHISEPRPWRQAQFWEIHY